MSWSVAEAKPAGEGGGISCEEICLLRVRFTPVLVLVSDQKLTRDVKGQQEVNATKDLPGYSITAHQKQLI